MNTLRILTLTIGLALITINWYNPIFTDHFQTILFVIGLMVIGIPHGGADRLIAIKTANDQQQNYTELKFSTAYFGQILLFVLLFFSLPHFALLLFLLMSAYHFGETDLRNTNDQSMLDKLLQLSYGVLILGVILLPNFSTVAPTLLLLNSTGPGVQVIDWIGSNHNSVLLWMLLFFIMISITYMILNRKGLIYNWNTITQLAVMLFILYQLPLLLSFSFYFILWHSMASLKQMLDFLVENQHHSTKIVLKEIAINSLIVLIGIGIVGYISSMYLRNDNLILYAIIGLAALTGPHMFVMHGMYKYKKMVPRSTSASSR